MLVVLGWKKQWKRKNRGQNLHKILCAQNSTKFIEKVKSPTEIMNINLYVENAGGFGVKRTMKKEKQGAKFTYNLMCLEFHQINGKGQVNHRKFKNQF